MLEIGGQGDDQMNVERAVGSGADRAVHFSGTWREFLPIALVNLLLTIVTLGIYRFWAVARVRRYLWSHTRIIDDELEWTGTGGEMFIGFVMVALVVILAVAAIFGISLVIGDWFLAVGVFGFYVFILWALNFAQFRALRYRLSRTYWRGIRGGSDENGVGYGWAAFGRLFVVGLTLGIMTPWATVENWNDRLDSMSFGPHQIHSSVSTEGLYVRWFGVIASYLIGAALWMAIDGGIGTQPAASPRPSIGLLAFGAVIGLALMAYWARYFRNIADGFEVGGISAGFAASTADWVKFYARLVGLTIVTLGFGALLWRLWRWQFIMDRLALYGQIDLDALTQSKTAATKDAEGFADAFDIGAF